MKIVLTFLWLCGAPIVVAAVVARFVYKTRRERRVARTRRKIDRLTQLEHDRKARKKR